MKNTVYVVARQSKWNSIEHLARNLGRHFLERLVHLRKIRIHVSEVRWDHIGSHATAFVQAGSERRTCVFTASRESEIIKSGLKNLQILKTADSGFSGYLKDEFTTLPETNDRLFGTVVDAEWTYIAMDTDFDSTYASIVTCLLNCFAGHKSLSVQQTLFAIGSAILNEFSVVQDVHITMPNKHRLLVDLARFGLDNPNEVFVPTDEPSGYIEAHIGR